MEKLLSIFLWPWAGILAEAQLASAFLLSRARPTQPSQPAPWIDPAAGCEPAPPAR
jgi:hypothetical protein